MSYLFEQPGVTLIDVPVPTALDYCNPSIVGYDLGYAVLVRALEPNPSSSSENWLIYFDRDLTRLSCSVLEDHLLRERCPEAAQGLEDGRLFSWRGSLWVIYSGLRKEQNRFFNTMVLCRIEGHEIVHHQVLDSPLGQQREKNWMPWVTDDALLFVYTTEPLVIYRLTDDRLVPLNWSGVQDGVTLVKPLGGSVLSGSSQVIDYRGCFIAITHHRIKANPLKKLYFKRIVNDPDYQRKKVIFYHYLMVFDRNGRLVARSLPFQFETRGVEFCAGIATHDDRLILSYGVMDRQARMVLMDPATVEGLFSQSPFG